jgi:hypothetical protein
MHAFPQFLADVLRVFEFRQIPKVQPNLKITPDKFQKRIRQSCNASSRKSPTWSHALTINIDARNSCAKTPIRRWRRHAHRTQRLLSQCLEDRQPRRRSVQQPPLKEGRHLLALQRPKPIKFWLVKNEGELDTKTCFKLCRTGE